MKINGLLAPVYYISPTQVNVQAPANLSGNVSVVVINNGVSSNTLTVAAVPSAPGLFYYTLSGRNFPSALYNGTYTIVGDPALYPQLAKAKAGDIIQLYGTGLGASPAGSLVNSPVVFSSPVTVSIGSASVTASYAGLVGVGLFQINFTVPALADGDYPIAIQTSGKTSRERSDPPDHALNQVGRASRPALRHPTRTSPQAPTCRARRRPTAAPPQTVLCRKTSVCLPQL